MGKVDFYILSGDGADEPLRVACRLADKAWRQGNRVRVQVSDPDALHRLDNLMWTFRQESFLPHEVDGGNAETTTLDPAPVMLGAGVGAGGHLPDVLINLTDAVPERADEISRIAEIVPADDGSKQAGRARYRRYREQGFELDSHEV